MHFQYEIFLYLDKSLISKDIYRKRYIEQLLIILIYKE